LIKLLPLKKFQQPEAPKLLMTSISGFSRLRHEMARVFTPFCAGTQLILELKQFFAVSDPLGCDSVT